MCLLEVTGGYTPYATGNKRQPASPGQENIECLQRRIFSLQGGLSLGCEHMQREHTSWATVDTTCSSLHPKGRDPSPGNSKAAGSHAKERGPTQVLLHHLFSVLSPLSSRHTSCPGDVACILFCGRVCPGLEEMFLREHNQAETKDPKRRGFL